MEPKNICIIGMGFIGTTLAAVLAEAGFNVFGVEKDKGKLEGLKKGNPNFHEDGLAEILLRQVGKGLHLFETIPVDKTIDVFIISVATPVDQKTKIANLDYVKNAITDLLLCLKDGQLVILRSTVPVGTSRNIIFPMLQQKCQNVLLSFCPERTIEGKALVELKTLPQIVGAINQESMDVSVKLFSKISPSIIKTSSLEGAEIVKLINNSYRDFSFAYANQIALICKNLGLDAREVIETANFGYTRSNIAQPGFVGGGKMGFVGGVCLEKDPYILINSSGLNGGLIKAAREINEGLIPHVFEIIKNSIEEQSFPNAKIFISGFAFKGHPATDDLRGSPAIQLLNLLKEAQAKNIYGHDFVVKSQELEKLGVKPCSIEEGLKDADAAVFMNNHKEYQDIDIQKLAEIMKTKALLFDGWQLFDEKLKNINSINYESIGLKRPSRK